MFSARVTVLGFLPAVLSLGSLCVSTGRRDEAARLYGQALARPACADAGCQELRRRIQAEYDGLR